MSREDRRRTVLPARVRSGAAWSDACILNISSRGLLIYADCGARPGSVIELRRGEQLVIARVVWRNNRRIGLCSDGQLRVEDIISSETAAAAVSATAGGPRIERRRHARDHERSRYRSRALEFVSLVMIATALSGTLAVYAQQTLSGTMTRVSAALAPR